MDRTVLDTWPICDCSDIVTAIEAAQEIVDAEGDDAWLSFALMTKAYENVYEIKLVKIDLSDSFAYELELS
jgi:predicted nicotinamide N-methyase